MVRSARFSAVLWMVGANIAFTLLAVSARQINKAHDTFEIMAFRSMIGFIVIALFGALTGRLGYVQVTRLHQHALRNIVHFTGQNLWFWAALMIPLAQLFAIEFTAPIWVLVLAPLFLGEQMTRSRILAVAFGFIGVLIVARPDFSTIDYGIIAASVAAVCFALTNITTRSITKHESTISILFWLTLMQLIFSFVLALWDGHMNLPTAQTLPWLIVLAFAGLGAHLCLTQALRLAPVNFVMPLDFPRLPLVAVIGALVYGEAIELATLIGAGFIIWGNWINLRGKDDTKVTLAPK